jgi:hypothetical protein
MWLYKWSLSKFGKGNTKGSMVGPMRNMETERVCFSFPGALKHTLTHGKGRTDSHPIIFEWGGAWAVPGPGECDF